ncbi:hypothetical protein D3C81_1841490 [compost metagenome]
MYQRRIGTLAQGGYEAVGGQLLAGAGAGGFAGQGRLEFFGVQLQILGKAVDKQVAEPHGDEALHQAKKGIIPAGALAGHRRLCQVVGLPRIFFEKNACQGEATCLECAPLREQTLTSECN